MSFKISSLNIRGLKNDFKRNQVFHWLKEQDFNICFLQETHLKASLYQDWLDEWGEQALFSGNKTKSEGVCILFKSDVLIKIVKHLDLITGRLQVVDITHNDKPITLINIYGPNNDDITLFNKLHEYLSENEDRTFIIGGDFNTVLDTTLDKINGRNDTHVKCREKLKSIIAVNQLTDIWRIKNPDSKLFSWHSNHKPPIFCRLDFFLLSNNIINNTVKTDVKIGYKTDHSMITLSLAFNKENRGPGYFKLNNSLILNEKYQQNIKRTISETVNFNSDTNPNILWELIKGSIRNETIRFATNKKREETKKEKQLNLDIKTLEEQIQNANNQNTIEILQNSIDNKKIELIDIIDKRINGIIVRSKALTVENNERNTKLFANLEKKRSESKIIKQLNVNGRVVTSLPDILNEQKIFYEHLYNKKQCTNSRYNFFLIII